MQLKDTSSLQFASLFNFAAKQGYFFDIENRRFVALNNKAAKIKRFATMVKEHNGLGDSRTEQDPRLVCRVKVQYHRKSKDFEVQSLLVKYVQ